MSDELLNYAKRIRDDTSRSAETRVITLACLMYLIDIAERYKSELIQPPAPTKKSNALYNDGT